MIDRDSIDDMTAGYRAGAATVLLVNEVNAHLATHEQYVPFYPLPRKFLGAELLRDVFRA